MSSSHKVIEDFINLQQRNAMVHAIRIAVELGILGALAGGQKTPYQIAEELGLQPIPLKKLLKVLENTEIVERYQEDYALSPLARLIPEPYLDFGDRYWGHLGEFIRTGNSISRQFEHPGESQKSILPEIEKNTEKNTIEPELDYRLQKLNESWLLTPQALEVAQLLDLGRSRRSLRILEIGSGSAVFSATLAHQDPNSVINLVDTCLGAEKSLTTIDSLSLQRQAEVIEVADVLQLDSVEELEGQQFDLIVVPGLIHRFDIDQLHQLLRQLVKLAKRSAEIAVIDVFPGQPGGETMHAIFDLELHLRTESGKLHEPQDLTRLLEKSGFHEVQFAYLASMPKIWGLFLARMPD